MEQRFVEAKSRMIQRCVDGLVFFLYVKNYQGRNCFIKIKNMTSITKPFHWKLVGHYWLRR